MDSGSASKVSTGPSSAPIAILYRDRWLCAVNKPPEIMVHPSKQTTDTEFLVDRMRAHFGTRVFPLHRLDRATSGALLFAFDREAAAIVGHQFERRRVGKTYHAIARGYAEPEATIDHALAGSGRKQPRPALTRYRRLATVELPIPVGRYPTARYSLVEARPETGRTHQIRRHFKHIFHPLIGDTTYGEGRHNRLFRERFDCHRLLLHASRLGLRHPATDEALEIHAPLCPVMARVVRMLFGDTALEGIDGDST